MAKIKSFKLRKGTSVNGYVVREPLGLGWEGEVYRVREEYSQGQRVLKLFDPSQYRSKHMYEYGARLDRLSEVPGVIRFYHGGYWEKLDCHYFVMLYVEGVTLERTIARRPMPLFRALRIVRDILKIVAECHAQKSRVGDIHADNIILTAGDKPTIIDLDLSSGLNRQNVVDDLTAASKLLYYLNRNGPYPADLRAMLSKHADALRRRYRSVDAVLEALSVLMGT
jgi:serine/threonine protein kinase